MDRNLNKDLTVRELLKGAYCKVCEKHDSKKILLPKRALVEIENDSDWHRTKIGYVGYGTIDLIQFGDKTWAIARGEKYGSYPSEPYDSDILALELVIEGKTSKQVQEELVKRIQGGSYFRNSLIFGMADGSLRINPSGRFGKRILDLLEPEIERFIAQEAEYDTSVISASTLQCPVTKPMLYKPEFDNFLAKAIEKVLKHEGG